MGYIWYFIQNYFHKIASTKRQVPSKVRRGALIVLSMTGRADKEILSNNMDTLVKVGIGEAAKVCFCFLLVGRSSFGKTYLHCFAATLYSETRER